MGCIWYAQAGKSLFCIRTQNHRIKKQSRRHVCGVIEQQVVSCVTAAAASVAGHARLADHAMTVKTKIKHYIQCFFAAFLQNEDVINQTQTLGLRTENKFGQKPT
jgi:hypothetical protein